MTDPWIANIDKFETFDARVAVPGGFFDHITSRADALPEGEGLHIIQSFDPIPLYAVLGAKGFVHHTNSVSDTEYHVYFYKTLSSSTKEESKAATMKAHLDLDPDRVVAIQGIVQDFYDGIDVPTLKARFDAEVESISGAEFAFVEQKMTEIGIDDDRFKENVEDLIRIFRSALARHESEDRDPGHPLDTFRKENAAIVALVAEIRERTPIAPESFDSAWWEDALERLWMINLHYVRKENQLFPRLEEKGFDKPSIVMWQIHDDIRSGIKQVRRSLAEGDRTAVSNELPAVLDQVVDMTFKEEKILFPTSEAMFAQAEWVDVRRGEEEVGYCLIDPPPPWPPTTVNAETVAHVNAPSKAPAQPFVTPEARPSRVGLISLEEGALTPDQISLLLRHLPMDVTFVDEYGQAQYSNHSRGTAFLKESDQDIAEFKTGVKDQVDTWSTSRGLTYHGRNIAVRDDDGNYRGTLLTNQDASALRALEGERRLLEWD